MLPACALPTERLWQIRRGFPDRRVLPLGTVVFSEAVVAQNIRIIDRKQQSVHDPERQIFDQGAFAHSDQERRHHDDGADEQKERAPVVFPSHAHLIMEEHPRRNGSEESEQQCAHPMEQAARIGKIRVFPHGRKIDREVDGGCADRTKDITGQGTVTGPVEGVQGIHKYRGR